MRGKIVFSLVFLLFAIYGANSTVIGIDFGTEWVKMSHIYRRSSEIVENEHSGRKTSPSFTFKDQIIVYSSDAKNLATKQPESVYKDLWPLLGKTIESEVVSKSSPFYPFPLEKLNETLGVPVSGLNGTIPVENLVGVVMRYLRELAKKHTNQIHVKDCVITVPPFWKHHERQAVLDAAKIGGWNVLSLLNHPTAVAINFALARSKELNDTNALFLDIGASTTTYSLVNFKNNNSTNSKTGVTTIHVVDFVWQENLGGRDFDLKIAEFIAKDVEKKHKVDVRSNKKAWTKILKEAQKTKEVLSANQETYIGIEGLTSDIDYKGKITRQEFESMSADLLSQFVPLLEKLLQDNSVSKESLSFIETFGGGIRIPKIQQILVEYIGRDLDKHVNGDEGAVMGAAWFAALQSPLYKVAGFKTKDVFPFSIEASISSPSQEFDRTEEIVPVGVKYGYRKVMNLKADESFVVSVEYGPNGKTTSNKRSLIGKWAVDISPGAKYNKENGTLNVSFRLTSSGVFELEKAELEVTIVTLPPPTEPPKVEEEKTEVESTSESTPSSDSTESTESSSSTEPTEASSESTEAPKEEAKKETKEKTKAKKETKPQGPTTKIHRVPLNVVPVKYFGLTPAQFYLADEALENINEIVRRKKEKEFEKSTLEAYIYEMKEKLSSDSEFEKFTNETQRESFLEALSAAGDWLYDEGEDTDIDTYREKAKSLKAFGDPIKERISEHTLRPQMLLKVFKVMNETMTSLNNITAKREVTEEEVEKFVDSCTELKNWMQTKLEEQDLVPLHQDPVVTTQTIWGRWQVIEYKAKTLLRRSLKKDKNAKKKKKKLPKNIKIDNPDYADFINFGDDFEDDTEETTTPPPTDSQQTESSSSTNEEKTTTEPVSEQTEGTEPSTPTTEESPKETEPATEEKGEAVHDEL
eukprot:TRINITY_DN1810_c0_g1_i1.p1 TRINITY_DN1810_c0_g1~~TRINITY_DN1810_c0_g1_i1.p1  ORF type:complete len:923 (-),score=444.06 TRINITY_DN1810_c0_g1_i1:147-2915(-)